MDIYIYAVAFLECYSFSIENALLHAKTVMHYSNLVEELG